MGLAYRGDGLGVASLVCREGYEGGERVDLEAEVSKLDADKEDVGLVGEGGYVDVVPYDAVLEGEGDVVDEGDEDEQSSSISGDEEDEGEEPESSSLFSSSWAKWTERLRWSIGRVMVRRRESLVQLKLLKDVQAG